MVKVTVWNEYLHEIENDHVRRIYPEGIHGAIASDMTPYGDFDCRTATLNEPEHGLTEEILDDSDVLVWWGHKAHARVSQEIVERVYQQVLCGMGLVVLHSGHFSRIFKRLMGTNCSLKWREADEKERLWNLAPGHPVMEGVGEYIELAREEMYGERFDIPEPDQLLMISWFQGGEVFRSCCTWQRGHGRIVYFRPGHETYPTYRNEDILRVIANACKWARRTVKIDTRDAPNARPLEPVPNESKTPIL